MIFFEINCDRKSHINEYHSQIIQKPYAAKKSLKTEKTFAMNVKRSKSLYRPFRSGLN